MKNRLCKTLATAAMLFCSLFATPAANAGVIQLGFIIDESGSIGASNYTTIKNGLANAINNFVPTDGSYEISVISFSTNAQVLVNHVLINSVAARTNVANAILADSYSAGYTYMGTAFNLMTTTLLGSTQAIDFSYVNFATDGVNTDSDATVIAARNNLISAAGVDNISVEAIGSGVDAAFLQNQICYPGPCDTTAPYSFPTTGFYIPVANAQGYANAISYKIQVVTNQVPEPGSMALLGLGLMGMVMARRRRSA